MKKRDNIKEKKGVLRSNDGVHFHGYDNAFIDAKNIIKTINLLPVNYNSIKSIKSINILNV